MAQSRTTLAGGMAATDIECTLVTIANLQLGDRLLIDGEMMRVLTLPLVSTSPVGVLRGIRGTSVAAHPVGAGVTYGNPADFSGFQQSKSKPRNRDVASYSVTPGTIVLPSAGRDAVAILNGTVALTMALPNPVKEADGDVLYIVSNGKAAHIVNAVTTVGLGGGGAAVDSLLFAAGAQQCLMLIAVNEVWCLVPSVVAGTLTNITVTAS